MVIDTDNVKTIPDDFLIKIILSGAYNVESIVADMPRDIDTVQYVNYLYGMGGEKNG